MPGLDEEAIRGLLRTAQKHGLRQVRLKIGSSDFSAVLPRSAPKKRSPDAVAAVTVPTGPEEVDVTAPVVGYFDWRKEPVAVGQKVEKGQVIAEIVALGLANDVVSPVEGEVVEVFAEKGQAVEFGKPLLKVRPS
ncbi:MAG: hypothetical protein KIT11_07445 [Fimbriimonadaceae bacterium]|nr:hypothetical protein [Fimbriimonadaceae bacterium]QYK56186.1 MAG: hypothetical protein KF733_01635 [Fimbriimonadaceae bacterium]